MCNIEKNERKEGKTRRRQERGTENTKEECLLNKQEIGGKVKNKQKGKENKQGHQPFPKRLKRKLVNRI